MWRNWLIGKEPDAEKDWRWEEKGTTADRMARWHHRLDGFEMNLRKLRELVMDREALCVARLGVTELDMTEQLNWVYILIYLYIKYTYVFYNWKSIYIYSFSNLFTTF